MNHLHHTVYFGSLSANLNLLQHQKYSAIITLCDENTAVHCFPILQRAIQQPLHLITIKAGEINKSITETQFIWQQLMEFQSDRKALLINLGGGVISDIGGFCASVYKRGIDFINIPTTLLGMVDAAIGGKTGINFLNYKNIIGSMLLPQAILIDPTFLKTLPQRNFLNGFAEMIKHGLIADYSHLNELILLKNINQDIPVCLIQKSGNIKQQIVNQDLNESGIRKVLNFGHTIGHAIESVALQFNHDLMHGEAVAEGMMVALELSTIHTGLSKNSSIEIAALIRNYYIKPLWISSRLNEIMAATKQDKKNEGEHLLFVLLKDIASPTYNIPCSSAEVLNLLKQMYP